MRSNSLFLTIGFLAAGCAHVSSVPDVVVGPPAPTPAMTTSAIEASETRPTRATSPSPEEQDLCLAERKAVAADTPSTASRNARSVPAAPPADQDPPFVERAAVEALDRIAYLFHA